MLASLYAGPLTKQDMGDLLDFLCSVSWGQEIYYLRGPLLKNTGDDLILEGAVAAGVDYLVTFKMNDFAGAESVGVILITPKVLLC